jgi:uncharacterized BrkB/YihY/UPF0761 family membrane protein
MKRLWSWLMAWRVVTVMPFLIMAWVWSWGWFASWINHGKPLIDDPSTMYANAMKVVPLFFSLLITMLYSGMANNSLTPEEYRGCAWQDRLVDNGVEVVIFITCVYFFAHSP